MFFIRKLKLATTRAFYASSIGTLATSILSGCLAPAPVPAFSSERSPQAQQPVAETLPQKASSPTPPKITISQDPLALKLHRISRHGVDFTLVSYDARDYQLELADQAGGPGSKWDDAKSAGQAERALAAINAGFFTPEGKPLGLVIDSGTKRGHFNSSSLGRGIYSLSSAGASIERSRHWRNLLKQNPSDLLQAGPMLLENGKTTLGLSNESSRPRSFIAQNGQHWVFGHASSCTLAELGRELAQLQVGNFRPELALNLDGGRSSDLWVSAEISGGPETIRPFWNKPVRNFLILKKK